MHNKIYRISLLALLNFTLINFNIDASKEEDASIITEDKAIIDKLDRNSKILSVIPTIWVINKIIASYVNQWELVKTLIGHTKAVNCSLFSKDGKILISGSEDGNLKFWDVHGNSQFYGSCTGLTHQKLFI